jgi:hypothetical protein
MSYLVRAEHDRQAEALKVREFISSSVIREYILAGLSRIPGGSFLGQAMLVLPSNCESIY